MRTHQKFYFGKQIYLRFSLDFFHLSQRLVSLRVAALKALHVVDQCVNSCERLPVSKIDSDSAHAIMAFEANQSGVRGFSHEFSLKFSAITYSDSDVGSGSILRSHAANIITVLAINVVVD